jgi:phosphoserine phosphatase
MPRAIAASFEDTFGDLALLNAADGLRVLVHPRPALLAHARQCADPAWVQFAPAALVSGEAVAAPRGDRVIQSE